MPKLHKYPCPRCGGPSSCTATWPEGRTLLRRRRCDVCRFIITTGERALFVRTTQHRRPRVSA